MFDYQSIKADDPGGTLAEAAVALAAMTITVDKDIAMFNIKNVASAHGLAFAEGIRQVMVAAFPEWVATTFVGSGFDITDKETKAALTKPPFSDDQIAKLLELTYTTVKKYPGIKPVHIQEARNL